MAPWAPRGRPGLLALARLYGVQGSYTNQAKRRVRTGPEALMATLRALGAPVVRPEDVGDVFRARQLEMVNRAIEPVVVAWNGRLPHLRVRTPARASRRWADVSLEVQDGASPLAGRAALLATGQIEVEGRTFLEHDVVLESPLSSVRLPAGYQRLTLRIGSREESTLVISAPRSVVDSRPGTWGVFLPLHALRTGDCWGVGDLGDLLALTRWVAGLGGSLVATLPLLPAFLDGPVFEPSPYSPVSRLFWNELYVDLGGVPEGSAAGRIVRSPQFEREIAELRVAPLVDYRRTMAARRRVLDAIAREAPVIEELEEFGKGRGSDYAAFRANMERRGSRWRTWPDAERRGRLPRRGGNPESYRYHLFAQWLLERQMGETAREAQAAGGGLYFDLPLGVHPDGYDVWREREAFVLGVSAGAPPDMFFSGGQNWGLPPAHPEGDRRNGYRYFRSCIAHLFRHATVARIDHVMGLHRIYVVPHGMPPWEGAYIRYRSEELYAILAVESHRHGTAVVGEDLGTVPRPVRAAMRAHGIHRTYVMQFELKTDRRRAITRPPELSLATLNTHDTPTFVAFWRGLDVRLRFERGWIGEADARQELRRRERIRQAVVAYLRARGWIEEGPAMPSERSVLRGVLSELAASGARMVVANLEDLWLEPRPQNIPGTTQERPNWRRPARYTFEEFSVKRSVTGMLRAIDRSRRAGDLIRADEADRD